MRGPGSYTEAGRTPRSHTINTIVIHATEAAASSATSGGSPAATRRLRPLCGRARRSIVQLVHLSDIAWHAGNWKVNCHSIGVEHVGETYDPAGFTADEYRSSAELVAWLVRRYDIPVDRKHIIGHAQVPDPSPRANTAAARTTPTPARTGTGATT